MTDGAHDHPLISGEVVNEQARAEAAEKALSDRIAALEGASPPVVTPPPVTPPSAGIGSAWVDTKDNIQVRQNGNGNVAIQLRKSGTGPITGVRIQDRFGPVYSSGTGGTYSVAAVTGSPDGTVVASTTWKPGTNGGVADAAFPTIMFDAASASIPDGTPFWIRFLNSDAKPDANYVSLNVLYIYGGPPSPRQPTFPDTDLAVLVNTGSGWQDRHETPNIDVLPAHEGFGYSQCLTGYWKPIGGSAQVRQTFTLATPLTFTRLGVRLRRTSGTTTVVTYSLETAAGVPVVSGNVPYATFPVSAPGGDDAGQTIGTLVVSATTIPAGTYRLRISSSGQYTATPARKALKGSYPTLTSDFQSFMCNGYAEYSSDSGKTWASLYGSPNQTDIQFAILA